MGIVTNRSSTRTGKLAFLRLALTSLAAFHPGFAEAQDIEEIRQAAEQGDARDGRLSGLPGPFFGVLGEGLSRCFPLHVEAFGETARVVPGSRKKSTT